MNRTDRIMSWVFAIIIVILLFVMIMIHPEWAEGIASIIVGVIMLFFIFNMIMS